MSEKTSPPPAACDNCGRPPNEHVGKTYQCPPPTPPPAREAAELHPLAAALNHEVVVGYDDYGRRLQQVSDALSALPKPAEPAGETGGLIRRLDAIFLGDHDFSQDELETLTEAKHAIAAIQSTTPRAEPAGDVAEIVAGLQCVLHREVFQQPSYRREAEWISDAIAALQAGEVKHWPWPVRTDRDPPQGDSNTWVLAWLVHESTPANWFQRSAKIVRDNPQTYPYWMPWPASPEKLAAPPPAPEAPSAELREAAKAGAEALLARSKTQHYTSTRLKDRKMATLLDEWAGKETSHG